MTISIKNKHMLGPHFEIERFIENENDAIKAREEIINFANGHDYTIHRDKVLKEVNGPVDIIKNIK